MEAARKPKRKRSYYTEEDPNGFIFRRLDGPLVEGAATEKTSTSDSNASSFAVTCSEGSVIPECAHDLVTTDGNSNTKRIKHEKAAMIKMFTESILSNQSQLQEAEVRDKLRQVMETLFANNDVIGVLSLPNRPTILSELTNRVEGEKKLIQQYEKELGEWEQAVEGIAQDYDRKLKSQETSQSDGSIEKTAATTILGDDVSLLDDPVVNVMKMDHAKQQLETLHGTVEEGLKQMSSVQDDVMKRMEQHVDQLTTAHQVPLPTQTPRTTIVQMKQIPNINDTFYHS